MGKTDKAAKRKAKLKARKDQAVQQQLSQCNRITTALMDLCAPILPEYIDDTNGLDLTGRGIAWRLGMVAWNIAVSGRIEVEGDSIGQMRLTQEGQQIIRQEINGLVRKKYEKYPALRTAIANLSVERSGDDVKPKVKLGDTFPEMPIPEFDSPALLEKSIPQQEELPMKHSFYDVKARAKVIAEVTDFVTYGEGKTKRYAFKAQTKDGRNLTAFVSKDAWKKAKTE